MNTETFYCPNCGGPLNIEVSSYIIKIECHKCNKFYIRDANILPLEFKKEIDINSLLEDAILHYFRDIVEYKMSKIHL